MQRAVWALGWLLLILLSVILCITFSILQSDQGSTLRLQERKVMTALPKLLLCPKSGPSPNNKRLVEKSLPVMKYMWTNWDRVRSNEAPDYDSLPWRNESASNIAFFDSLMFEGGRLAMSVCGDYLENCQDIKSETVFTSQGVCLQLSKGESSNLGSSTVLQEKFEESRNLFSVQMGSTNSRRIGHPVISMNYFGDSLLCDNQWSQAEAQVMCREMGFESGAKFYKSIPDAGTSISYAQYLGKFQCTGDESRLSYCQRNVISHCERSPDQKLSLLLCDVGGLDGVHKQTKVRGHPYVEGSSSEQYFCAQNFTNREATVFCKMLGWSSGRSVGAAAKTGVDTMSVSCQGNYLSHNIDHSTVSTGQENHLLDCQHLNTTCDQNVARVACDPGFPLTLRLHKEQVPAFLSTIQGVEVGYPVIDTTENMGLMCSEGTNQQAVEKICQMLGFRKV